MMILITLLWAASLYVAYRVGTVGQTVIYHDQVDSDRIGHLSRELNLLHKAHNKTLRKMKTYRKFAYEHNYKAESSKANGAFRAKSSYSRISTSTETSQPNA